MGKKSPICSKASLKHWRGILNRLLNLYTLLIQELPYWKTFVSRPSNEDKAMWVKEIIITTTIIIIMTIIIITIVIIIVTIIIIVVIIIIIIIIIIIVMI